MLLPLDNIYVNQNTTQRLMSEHSDDKALIFKQIHEQKTSSITLFTTVYEKMNEAEQNDLLHTVLTTVRTDDLFFRSLVELFTVVDLERVLSYTLQQYDDHKQKLQVISQNNYRYLVNYMIDNNKIDFDFFFMLANKQYRLNSILCVHILLYLSPQLLQKWDMRLLLTYFYDNVVVCYENNNLLFLHLLMSDIIIRCEIDDFKILLDILRLRINESCEILHFNVLEMIVTNKDVKNQDNKCKILIEKYIEVTDYDFSDCLLFFYVFLYDHRLSNDTMQYILDKTEKNLIQHYPKDIRFQLWLEKVNRLEAPLQKNVLQRFIHDFLVIEEMMCRIDEAEKVVYLNSYYQNIILFLEHLLQGMYLEGMEIEPIYMTQLYQGVIVNRSIINDFHHYIDLLVAQFTIQEEVYLLSLQLSIIYQSLLDNENVLYRVEKIDYLKKSKVLALSLYFHDEK